MKYKKGDKCLYCDKNVCSRGIIGGVTHYKPVCVLHKRDGTRRPKPGTGYRKHKGSMCEICGFIPVDLCQLDVDHVDGDHDNNDPTNLQTICANCHRLKTKLNKDGWYA